ncbi:endonuclease/exonuclease/phosphatase family protein [Pseudoruegeria sp. HB172150]|uniref:endonuclease/exonuclease/phosphatase family protein n=1 Tax=Pseudoruegeria sp. HB172150 TaxID=2721164 RepID=UPI001553CCF5|nr:endonuclease/exonuclease/phosphatase family protein [Pseudoruegeria sp. HB172150]
MRIVSLNAWGGQVWDALGPWLGTVGADVLCLQEVIRGLAPGPEWLRYGDAFRSLDQRRDLFADVSADLPGYQARFAPAARGDLLDADGGVHPSEHGIAQWVAPDLAIAGQWQGFVHGSFRVGGWGEEPVPRTCQVTRIATGDDSSVVVGHLHGLRDPSGKGDTPERSAQWRALAAAVETFREPGEPVVVAGDLNVLPGSDVFGVLGGIGLTDLVTTRGHDDTRTSLYKKPQRHANYMFVSPEVRVVSFDVPAEPVVSDHRPLILDLAF